MRRYSLIARRLLLALSCTVVGSLAVVASAQAVVVNDIGTEAGVALVPARAGRRDCQLPSCTRRDRERFVQRPMARARSRLVVSAAQSERSATAAAP